MKKDDPGKLLRLFKAVNLLASNKRGYTVKELAEKLQSSWRTVYRDLEIIEKTGFTLSRNTITKRVHLTRAEDWSESVGFKKEEAEIVKQAILGMEPGSLKDIVLAKVEMLSGNSVEINVLKNARKSIVFGKLMDALKQKKQVKLVDYQSVSSNSVSTRLVEPFDFNDGVTSVLAYEPASKMNKHFKIDRILEVVVTDYLWQNEVHHKKEKVDLFGVSGEKTELISWEMGNLSNTMLREEYPRATPFIKALDNGIYLFSAEVYSFKAPMRFVLGLLDDVEVKSSASFKKQLKEKLKKTKIV